MVWLGLIPIVGIAAWLTIRSIRSKEIHELSRERKLILLSLHEAKPKPFKMIYLDKFGFRGLRNDQRQEDGQGNDS